MTNDDKIVDGTLRRLSDFRAKQQALTLRYVADGNVCYLVAPEPRRPPPPAERPLHDAEDDGA